MVRSRLNNQTTAETDVGIDWSNLGDQFILSETDRHTYTTTDTYT